MYTRWRRLGLTAMSNTSALAFARLGRLCRHQDVKELLDMRKSHVMARVRHVIPDVCLGILRLVLVVLVRRRQRKSSWGNSRRND